MNNHLVFPQGISIGVSLINIWGSAFYTLTCLNSLIQWFVDYVSFSLYISYHVYALDFSITNFTFFILILIFVRDFYTVSSFFYSAKGGKMIYIVMYFVLDKKKKIQCLSFNQYKYLSY